jgi:histidinol-phosphate phosphatase family protein
MKYKPTEKILFVDRDGVINKYPGNFKYVTSWSSFKFLPGVKKALKKLNNAGFKIFIISNQAGVSKGLYSQKALDKLTRRMLLGIESYGGKISGVYYCIHRDIDKCSCRKPKPGLIKKALKEHGFARSPLKNTYMIGDSIRDIQTGKNAGCRTILVLSGRDKLKDKRSWQIQPDFIAKNLLNATDILL